MQAVLYPRTHRRADTALPGACNIALLLTALERRAACCGTCSLLPRLRSWQVHRCSLPLLVLPRLLPLGVLLLLWLPCCAAAIRCCCCLLTKQLRQAHSNKARHIVAVQVIVSDGLNLRATAAEHTKALSTSVINSYSCHFPNAARCSLPL